MARIPEYDAPVTGVDLNPSVAGFNALETAGRRLGPAYQQAAGDYKTMGRVAGDMIESGKAVLEFSRFRDASIESGKAPSVGGLKIRGSLTGDGGGRAARTASQTGRAAPRLAEMASDLVSQQSPLAARSEQSRIAANAKETETAQQGLINQQHEAEAMANKAYYDDDINKFARQDTKQFPASQPSTGNRPIPTMVNDNLGQGGYMGDGWGALGDAVSSWFSSN